MEEKSMTNKALLVVSFGTSYKETREKNIEHIEKILAQKFPDRKFFHAYTSGMILKKLRERDHIIIPNVKEAMEDIVKEGFTDLLVQPTHIMNGVENDLMKADVLSFREHFSSLSFGAPLLTDTSDLFYVIDALTKELPALSEQEALVFMGHGSTHYANMLYGALDYAFKQTGHPHVYVGTVEAYPDLDAVLELMEGKGYRHVYLAPLMLVAGDHASNDLAGVDEDSWKSIFQSRGYETTCILKGLGEYESICELYVRHALRAQPV